MAGVWYECVENEDESLADMPLWYWRFTDDLRNPPVAIRVSVDFLISRIISLYGDEGENYEL